MSASEERVPASGPETNEAGEEEYRREPFHDAILEKKPKGLAEKFKALPLGKKIAVILLIIGLIGAAGVGATIVSNILSGATSITGLTISAVNPPLLPDQATLETDYTNALRVYNPTGAAYTGWLTMNFTASRGPLESSHFEIYVDLNGNGVFESSEKMACTVISASQVKCATPSFSIPSGTADFLIKIRFKSGLPAPNTLNWQAYVEAT
jgi:hypothetical protein